MKMRASEIFDIPNSSKLEPYLIGIIITYPLLFVWQGLDFTDMGFSLTGYQQFITNPEAIGNGIVNWGSYAVGFLVTKVSGDLGVIAYKLADALVGLFTLAISFLMLNSVRRTTSRALLMLLVFIGMLYVNKMNANWINYNSLTAFVYVAGAALLYFGLIRSSLLLIVLSGLVIGLGMFVRLPNFLGILLVAAIPLWGWSERINISTILIQCGIFLLSYFLAIIMMVSVMEWFGHLSIYKDALGGIVSTADDSESHHSSGLLIKLFVWDHLKAFGLAGGAVVAGYVFSQLTGLLDKKGRAIIFLLGVALSLVVLPIADMWKWVVTGFCYVTLLVAVFRAFRVDNKLMLLSFIAGLVLLLAPLGSGNGIRNAIYGSWLALPLALLILWRTEKIALGHFQMGSDDVRFLAVFAIVVLILFSLILKATYTYRDSPNRFSLTHTINQPLLSGVLTTESRAKVVGEVLREMSRHVRPGDNLLAYNEIPTIHYLTRTVPWLGRPWPMLLSPDEIAKLLKDRELSNAVSPVIVRATGNTSNRTWPSGNREFVSDYQEDSARDVFRNFEQRNGYHVVWQNDYFEILKRSTGEKDTEATE